MPIKARNKRVLIPIFNLSNENQSLIALALSDYEYPLDIPSQLSMRISLIGLNENAISEIMRVLIECESDVNPVDRRFRKINRAIKWFIKSHKITDNLFKIFLIQMMGKTDDKYLPFAYSEYQMESN